MNQDKPLQTPTPPQQEALDALDDFQAIARGFRDAAESLNELSRDGDPWSVATESVVQELAKLARTFDDLSIAPKETPQEQLGDDSWGWSEDAAAMLSFLEDAPESVQDAPSGWPETWED